MERKTLEIEVLSSPDEMKNIAITCKCGTRAIHPIPKVLLETHQRIVVRCKMCSQPYGVSDGAILRLTPELTPDGTKISKAIPQVGKAESGQQKPDQEIVDHSDVPFVNGTFVTNGDKHVN
jgi:hypothetical protein